MQSKIDSFQITDFDIQKDFYEVWISIEKSLGMFEKDYGKQPKKKKSDKTKTTINLNLEL